MGCETLRPWYELSTVGSMVVVTVKVVWRPGWTLASPNRESTSMVPTLPNVAAVPLKMVLEPDVMLTAIFEQKSVAEPEEGAVAA